MRPRAATILTIDGILDKTSADGITAVTTINNGGTMNVTTGFTHTGDLTVGEGAGGSLDIGGNTLTINSTFDLMAGATLNTTINSNANNDAGSVVVDIAIVV